MKKSLFLIVCVFSLMGMLFMSCEPTVDPKPTPTPDPTAIYIDIDTADGVFGSGGTYGHIQIDGESILVTNDRQVFNGRKDVSELAQAFVANNKGSAGANEHQKGYKAELVAGYDTVLKVTKEDGSVIAGDSFTFLGLEGWNPSGNAGIQPKDGSILITLP